LEEFVEQKTFFRKIAAGIVQALLFILLFALCPVIFKAIANFGSNAVSVNQAEYRALKYYWWFMLFTAFAGTAVGTMMVEYFSAEQRSLNNLSVQSVFFEVAGSLPSTVAANWINWIIIRSTCTLPLQYMLQVNTFIFQSLGWKCCRRCVMGGGPGGHTPYRIYIDSGVVFLCVVALSPSSPSSHLSPYYTSFTVHHYGDEIVSSYTDLSLITVDFDGHSYPMFVLQV